MHNRIQTGGLAMALLAGLGSSSGFGAVLSVTSTNDNDAGSLRQAISRAAPGDTVEFAVRGGITLTNGELFITKDLTINGPGAANLFINGNAQSRVFHINSNITASISGLTITNGLSPAGADNTVDYGPSGEGYPGGGIFNEGTLTLAFSAVSGNHAGNGGFTDPPIAGRGKGGYGGGIANTGFAILDHCLVNWNVAGSGGGASDHYDSRATQVGDGGDGGGLYNSGSMTISNSIVSDNQGGSGGAPCSIGGGGGGIFNSGTVRFIASTLRNNVSGLPGSSYNTGVKGGMGGGAYNAGNMSFESSLICSNSAGKGGQGAVFIYSGQVVHSHGGVGGNGGGVYNTGELFGTNSTWSLNTAGGGGPGGDTGNGGSGGGICNGGVVRLVNCTVCGNITGDLSSVFPGSVVSSHDGIGGGLYSTGGLFSVFNSLIARNLIFSSGATNDVYGQFVSLGHNLVGVATTNGFGVSGDIVGSTNAPVDALVGMPADNGGTMQTCALLAGSPAIDAGEDAVLSDPWFLTTDQRGTPRKHGAHVDIGAFEFNNDDAQFAVTLTAIGHGSVSVTPVLPSYPSNTVVTVVATPGDNAIFGQWSGFLSNTSQTNTIVVTTNVALQGRFLDLFTLSTISLGGSIETGSSSNIFVEGTMASLVAVPSNGWQFTGWHRDATGVDARIDVLMNSNKTVEAEFGTTLTVSANGNGVVWINPPLPVFPYGASVTLYGAPDEGSVFSGWESAYDLGTNRITTLVITNAKPAVAGNFLAAPAPTVWTVTSTNDSGSGSFRQAVLDARANDRIQFAVKGVITLANGEVIIDKSLSIVGPGANVLALSGNRASRVLTISSNVSVTVSGLTIRDGFPLKGVFVTTGPGNPGGGILNFGFLTLNQCVVSGNSSGNGGWDEPNNGANGGNGGGINNLGLLRLDSCLVSSNTTGSGQSGNIFGFGGSGGSGGGIFSDGILLATNSTIVGNSTGNGGDDGSDSAAYPGGNGGFGGGIYSLGVNVLINCTISQNGTGLGGQGGYSVHYGTTGPRGIDGFGGGMYISACESTLYNTLVAGNTVSINTFGPDVGGNYVSMGHNLIGVVDASATGFGATGDLFGTRNHPLNAMLGVLADNGGPTMTCALLPGSPAIDAGDDAALSDPWNLTTDQRGYPRKSGAHVDIGAFELTNPAALFHLNVSFSAPAQALRLDITGTAGKRLDVLTSTDLVHWTRLTTVTNETGKVSLTQPLNSTNAAQFYRAQELP